MTDHADNDQPILDGVELFRPVGSNELALIKNSKFRAFPPRLPEQPIFYPVTNFEYAEQIARGWNSTDPGHGNLGYVTRFRVRREFLESYETHTVGGQIHTEYWIPADDLKAFNANLIEPIEVVAEYRHGNRID